MNIKKIIGLLALALSFIGISAGCLWFSYSVYVHSPILGIFLLIYSNLITCVLVQFFKEAVDAKFWDK